MNKKILIILSVIIVLIVAVIAYFHFTPFWTAVSNLIWCIAGLVAGWFCNVFYNKYIKDDE